MYRDNGDVGYTGDLRDALHGCRISIFVVDVVVVAFYLYFIFEDDVVTGIIVDSHGEGQCCLIVIFTFAF